MDYIKKIIENDAYSEIEAFFEKINESSNVLIMAHVNPDGDAIGSSLGLKMFIEKLEKNVSVCLDDMPNSFSFIKEYEKVKSYYDVEKELEESKNWYDLVICIDLGDVTRLDKRAKFFYEIPNSIVIDHHVKKERFCDITIIDEKETSASQIVYNIIEYYEKIKDTSKKMLDKDILTSLITGIITDTGGFRFDSVNDKTFEIAKVARNNDISFAKIMEECMMKKSKNEVALQKIALNNMKYYLDGKLVITYLDNTYSEYKNAKPGETDAIVGMLRSIEGVEVAVVIKEEEEKYKLSFRTKTKDIIPVVSKLNGGGHKNAAGGEFIGTINDAIEKIIELVDSEVFNKG